MSTVPFHRSQNSPLDKELPHNFDAEKSVLGAILIDNATLKIAAAHLNAGDFFRPKNVVSLSHNGRIFMAMLRLADEKKPIELLTLTEHLQARDEFAAYIASLADGMPKVSNVEHYVNMVKQKSLLRQVIHKGYEIAERGYETSANYDELLTDFALFSKQTASGTENKLIAVDVRDFLTMNLSPKEYMIEPILPVRNSGMIYAPTGAGKTYIMLHLAYCVAIGFPTVFVWDIPKQRRVVYVEGEMDAQDLQERVQDISRGFDGVFPEPAQLRIIASDLPGQTAIPRINSGEGRKRIEEHLSGDELLILDNLSALCPSADEDESSEWSVVQEWILSLRRRGIGVFLVHHPGKSGSQLGTSKKEFQLSCNLHVRVPSNYDLTEGLRVEVKLDKLRSRGTGEFKPKWAQPFEISLRTEGEKGSKAAVFSHRPLRELLRQRAFEMLQSGMRENDVSQETGLDRFTIYRIKQKMKNGTPITEV